ncbi:F0F1 ATP synthase subunit delta [Chryseomicrobium palamuruense]|uniref:ATP synthase subunit delta n=1 Tax=Chryseomicrobium palamuruense TaxID=682973 RepID=A0ABV8UUI3_9BACL
MSKSAVAKRYAIALFELARENDTLVATRDDLTEIKAAWKQDADVQALFASPKLSLAKKKEMIRTVFGSASPAVVNTLQLLVEKKRLHELPAIVDEFSALSNNAQGIAEATVYSTRALTDEERAHISAAFAQEVGKGSLNIQNVVDPSLIGGLRIQIGNRIYDNTLSSKLTRLKRNLIG